VENRVAFFNFLVYYCDLEIIQYFVQSTEALSRKIELIVHYVIKGFNINVIFGGEEIIYDLLPEQLL